MDRNLNTDNNVCMHAHELDACMMWRHPCTGGMQVQPVAMLGQWLMFQSLR